MEEEKDSGFDDMFMQMQQAQEQKESMKEKDNEALMQLTGEATADNSVNYPAQNKDVS